MNLDNSNSYKNRGRLEVNKYLKINVAFFVLILSSFFAFQGISVDAYKTNPYKISSPLTFIPHNNFSSTSISHFNDALYQWNAQAGKTLMTRHSTSRHTSNSYPQSDGINRIYRKGVGVGTYVAQATTRYNTTTKKVIESDINMNISHPFANGAQPDKFDVWTVFLHETGHSAGLGHSAVASAVMYPTIKHNQLKRTLSSDDKLGINELYK